MFRVAKATGVWDVDQLEEQIPLALVAEWNQYLNWELEQIAQAVMAALPEAGIMMGAAPARANVITDKTQIGAIFDALGAK